MGNGNLTVLDTHAWIWWTSDPDRLSRRATLAVRSARLIGVPAISCWEFARLVVRRRIAIDRGPLDWIRSALSQPRVELLPITPLVAVHAAQLPDSFPGDPCDRLIVAAALSEGCPLISKDERIRRSGLVETIW